MTETTSPAGGFELRIFFRADSLASPDAARPLLDVLLAQRGSLTLDRIWRGPESSVPLGREAVERLLGSRQPPDVLFLGNEHGVQAEWRGFGPDVDPGSMLWLTLPFSLLAGDGAGQDLLALAHDLCVAAPPAYGWGHAAEDVRLGRDPHRTNPFAPKQVYEAYWLMVLGAPIVRKLKRAHVADTPAWRVDILPDGSALIATSPHPADVLGRSAREAQARALAHLRPEAAYEPTLGALLGRSERLAPVERAWPADLAQVLERILQAAPLAERRATEERFNHLRPAQVTEWRPAAEALPADVDDPDDTVDDYHRQAETFVAGFHASIPGLIEAEPDALAWIDASLYLRDLQKSQDTATLERLFVPTLGAYLGTMLERQLEGRWLPRRKLEEAQVVVGDRAWLPFLRVRDFVQSRAAMLDHSLTQLYREAERHAQSPQA